MHRDPDNFEASVVGSSVEGSVSRASLTEICDWSRAGREAVLQVRCRPITARLSATAARKRGRI